MTKFTAIKILIKQASDACETATQELGQVVRMAGESNQKLTLLLQYRNDYEARFHTSRTEGVTMTGYRNFQIFLAKLDVAIKSQQQVVHESRERVEEGKQAWQEAEKKKMSYSTLAKRQHTEAVRKESQREQKQMDDLVNSRLHHKR